MCVFLGRHTNANSSQNKRVASFFTFCERARAAQKQKTKKRGQGDAPFKALLQTHSTGKGSQKDNGRVRLGRRR